MRLRTKILIYMTSIHVILGVVVFLALRDRPFWLLGAEAVFAVSIVIGVMLVREFFVPLDLIRTGAELIREADFTSRFREVGQPEMDVLIEIYNRMIDRLREERLRLEEQHVLLDKILRASPAGIITLDFDDRVDLVNPTAAAMLGQDLTPQGQKLEALEGMLAGQLAGVGIGESDVLPLHGGRRVRVRRVGFVDRGFHRSFLLLEELTDELRASEKAAYGKLIRMMSHEVNNSVGAVRSLLETCRPLRAQLGPDDRDDFGRALDVSVGRLEHLNSFMNGFADVVRLPAPEPRPCDLLRLVKEIALLMRPQLDDREIALDLETPDELPEISLDKNQMEQVLLNVIKNAAESIGEQGTIRLAIARENGGVRVTVRDSGAGIEPDVRSQLFTPFFSTKRDGRGLGLTLIREILTGHGFEFGLTDLDGRGAEFRIDLSAA